MQAYAYMHTRIQAYMCARRHAFVYHQTYFPKLFGDVIDPYIISTNLIRLVSHHQCYLLSN